MRNYDKKVSVIMGVYNQWDEQILLDSVNSILKQTLQDFEFIIYDDGSEKQVSESIHKLASLDDRIVLIGKEENHGLAFSLNQCIEKARGEYIARMDSDDISMPMRLERQVAFMEEHPEYTWCGCNAEVFDENGVWGERKMPESPAAEDYLRFSPFIHPSVMYRAEVFETMKGYQVSEETLRCEDYEIFMRFFQAGYKGYNIQENLFQYRENKASFQRRSFKARKNEAIIRYRNFKNMGILWPKGWIYVARPIIAGLVPYKFLMWLKRSEAKGTQNETKATEQEKRVLQSYIAEKANL